MQILSGLQVLWPDPEAATQAGWFPPRGTEPPSPPLELPRGGGLRRLPAAWQALRTALSPADGRGGRAMTEQLGPMSSGPGAP